MSPQDRLLPWLVQATIRESSVFAQPQAMLASAASRATPVPHSGSAIRQPIVCRIASPITRVNEPVQTIETAAAPAW